MESGDKHKLDLFCVTSARRRETEVLVFVRVSVCVFGMFFLNTKKNSCTPFSLLSGGCIFLVL